MDFDTVNLELQEAAEELRQEELDVRYQEFMEDMYYLLECEQYERDMELYDEFG